MVLLYGSLAYMVGILAGRVIFDWLGLTCPLPGWLWLLPLALLPLTPVLNRTRKTTTATPLRWPLSAGFEPERSLWSAGLLAALALCASAGALRYAGHPFTQCWTPFDLAYYNLPANQAFERSAPSPANASPPSLSKMRRYLISAIVAPSLVVSSDVQVATAIYRNFPESSNISWEMSNPYLLR